jgi:antitoxin (DNA-binding transcriptional repressor) of toxin-antitoxin stability system
METIHISEEEAARDFAGLIARVRAGAEVVIENANSPAVVLRTAELPRGRLLSESIAIAEARTRERGYAVVMDPDFAADMEDIIANRKPRDTSAWD